MFLPSVGEGPAGNPTGSRAIREHRIPVPGNPASHHLKSGQLAPDAFFELLDDLIPAHKIAFCLFDNPVQARFRRKMEASISWP